MKIVQVRVANFRGIAQGTAHLDGHSVLVGDNNAGKSTLLEAIDLVLGPERLSRRPVVDEHDFYAGQYLSRDGQPIPLSVEVIVADLNDEQLRHFREHIEWWDTNSKTLLVGPPVEGTDAAEVGPALRVFFRIERLHTAAETVPAVFAPDPAVLTLALLALELLDLGLVDQGRARMRAASCRAVALREPAPQMATSWIEAMFEQRVGNAERVADLAERLLALRALFVGYLSIGSLANHGIRPHCLTASSRL